jgi:hypothetical protein
VTAVTSPPADGRDATVRCVGCGRTIDGPAVAGPSGIAAHPACLAAHLPADALAVVLAGLALSLAPVAVVWAG